MTDKTPVILNFDGSQGAIAGATELLLSDWQEAIRFGCSLATLQKLAVVLQQRLPAEYGTVLTGSGDFHHLSWPLVERCQARGPFQVVLFDNHPDNMRFPFGIHCGSWVRKVALLPCVSHVHVLGVTSQDIALASAWQQYWLPLLQGKLTYWCMDVDVRWAAWFGLEKAFRRFENPDELIASFISSQCAMPTYLTIDKDVLSAEAVNTNWDQGRLLERHLCAVIDELQGTAFVSGPGYAPYIILGVGGAAFVAGGVLTAVTFVQKGDLYYNDAKTRLTAGIAVGSVGLAAVAAGAIWAAVGSASAETPKATAGLVPTRGGAAITLSGSF